MFSILIRSRSQSPAKSTTNSRESLARSKTPEEVNYAFTGSMDDLSSTRSADFDERSPSVSSGEVVHHSGDGEKSKPAKRQRSFSKSPIKQILSATKENAVDKGTLVTDNDIESNAFDNPALGHEWSSFVNEEEEPSSTTPSPYKKLLKEPEPAEIDRGDNLKSLIGSDNQDFNDEVLVVEQATPLPYDDLDQQNTSSLSKTGFDFLDNW